MQDRPAVTRARHGHGDRGQTRRVKIEGMRLAREIGLALGSAGLPLADGTGPGVRVVPVAAGVRVRWVPGYLEAVAGPELLADLRSSVHSVAAGLLADRGFAVAGNPSEADVLVMLRRPAGGGPEDFWRG